MVLWGCFRDVVRGRCDKKQTKKKPLYDRTVNAKSTWVSKNEGEVRGRIWKEEREGGSDVITL